MSMDKPTLPVEQNAGMSGKFEDKFRRCYAVEIVFDTPIDFAEQDRLACVVLEKLVDEFWEDASAGTRQGNVPIEVVAFPILNPIRRTS